MAPPRRAGPQGWQTVELGYSDLFVEVLGAERGRGARSAVGMIALPVQIPVEVEMVLQISTG